MWVYQVNWDMYNGFIFLNDVKKIWMKSMNKLNCGRSHILSQQQRKNWKNSFEYLEAKRKEKKNCTQTIISAAAIYNIFAYTQKSNETYTTNIYIYSKKKQGYPFVNWMKIEEKENQCLIQFTMYVVVCVDLFMCVYFIQFYSFKLSIKSREKRKLFSVHTMFSGSSEKLYACILILKGYIWQGNIFSNVQKINK